MNNQQIPHRPEGKPRILVWVDRASDHICIADGYADRCEEGKPIPAECIVRIPLVDGEDFIEAVLNARGENAAKVIDGIQAVLDKRAAEAVALSEHLRLETSKRSLGVVARNQNEVVVRLDRHRKLEALLVLVKAVVEGNGQRGELRTFVEDNDL